MDDHTIKGFEEVSAEISAAISTLNSHGIKLSLPDDLMSRLDWCTLFDGDDLLFKHHLEYANVYFEYGCGKSTEFVLKCSNAQVFAVDTSAEWVNRLQSSCQKPFGNRIKLQWVDVGPVGNWGTPTSYGNRANFSEYRDWLWNLRIKPDLVLIDGRFRVSCFLASLKFADIGTKIIFDDYYNRPHYHVAQEFCDVVDRCGRQALFIVTANAKQRVTDSVLHEFVNVIQ